MKELREGKEERKMWMEEMRNEWEKRRKGMKKKCWTAWKKGWRNTRKEEKEGGGRRGRRQSKRRNDQESDKGGIGKIGGKDKEIGAGRRKEKERRGKEKCFLKGNGDKEKRGGKVERRSKRNSEVKTGVVAKVEERRKIGRKGRKERKMV